MSPPGMIAAGFCVAESAVAVEAARAPPAGTEERGGGQARTRPAAPERSPEGLRSPLASGWGNRVVPATVVDHVAPHRGHRKLFWDQSNWAPACKRCHDAKTAREGRWG